MASRTIATLTDDIYGGDAEETARFTFNGTQYEIDLSKKSVDEMVKAAALTTTTAARATAARTTGGRRSGSGPHDPPWRRRPARQDPRPRPPQRPPGPTAAASAPLTSLTRAVLIRLASLEVRVRLRVIRTAGRLRDLVLVGSRRWSCAVGSIEFRWWRHRPASAGRTILRHCRTLRIPPRHQSLSRRQA